MVSNRTFFVSPTGGRFEVFAGEDGRLAFKREHGVGNATFVLSIPKAGTYLVAKLLERLGLVDLEVHIWQSGFSDYRGQSLHDKVERARTYTVRAPLVVSLSFISTGQFAVGHIPRHGRTETLLGGFSRILVVREMRAALASMMRFEGRRLVADPLREGARGWLAEESAPARMKLFLEHQGASMLENSKDVAKWIADEQAVLARFEVLMGDRGREAQTETIRRIARGVGVPEPDDATAIADAIVGAETVTLSGKRTDHAAFWDDAVEAKFAALGGRELNAVLGYE